MKKLIFSSILLLCACGQVGTNTPDIKPEGLFSQALSERNLALDSLGDLLKSSGNANAAGESARSEDSSDGDAQLSIPMSAPTMSAESGFAAGEPMPGRMIMPAFNAPFSQYQLASAKEEVFPALDKASLQKNYTVLKEKLNSWDPSARLVAAESFSGKSRVYPVPGLKEMSVDQHFELISDTLHESMHVLVSENETRFYHLTWEIVNLDL